jgi:alpha-1,6-mannosyltransferase
MIMSLSDALIFVTAWAHVLLAPYTKVEESFNLHATHDVLMYGVGIDNLYNVRVRPCESNLCL